MGPPQSAIMNLTVDSRRVNAVAEELAQFEEAQFFPIVAGLHNIVVNVSFNTQEELHRFFNKLGTIWGIIHYDYCFN